MTTVQQEREAKTVYYIASRVMSKKVFVESGTIACVDHEYQTFVVIGERSEEKKFKVSDYFELVYPSYQEAQAFANKLPEVGQTVYHVWRQKSKISEETIMYFDVPYMYFKSGDGVKVTELDKTIFLKREQALEALNN